MANQIYSVVFEGGAVATLDHVAHIYHGGKDILLKEEKEFTHKISMKEDMLGSVDDFEEWLKKYEFYYVRENSPGGRFIEWEVIFLIKINSVTELKFVDGFLTHAYVKYTVEEVK